MRPAPGFYGGDETLFRVEKFFLGLGLKLASWVKCGTRKLSKPGCLPGL